MGASEPRGGAGGAARRRFITRHHVEDAVRSGTPIVVGARDVVTDEAAQRAEDLGVRIEREMTSAPAAARAPTTASAAAAAPPSTQDLRTAVHAAVVAELGREPDGLAVVIDRVLRRRGR